MGLVLKIFATENPPCHFDAAGFPGRTLGLEAEDGKPPQSKL